MLNGASLSLDRGEIVALEGPSGSGKTTFLTILGCMLTPSSGPGRASRARRSTPAGRSCCRRSAARRSGSCSSSTTCSRADGGGERRVRAEPQGNQGGQGAAEAARLLEAVGLADRPVSCRGTSPAARSSGWRSPAPWPARRRSSWPTSRPRTSTLKSARRSWSCSAGWRSSENRALLIVTHDPKVRVIADRVVRIRDGIIAT